VASIHFLSKKEAAGYQRAVLDPVAHKAINIRILETYP